MPKGKVSRDKSVNVQVAVRCRPLNRKEKDMGSSVIVEVDGTQIRLLPPPGDEEGARLKTFTYDFSYGMDTEQRTLYADVGAPTVEAAFEGFNTTIFAYGQTGSGKTYSMVGDEEGKAKGVIPLLNDELFDKLAALKEEAAVAAAESAESESKESEGSKLRATEVKKKFMVTVSYLEIYNEVIKDLLNPSDKVLKIRQHPDMGIYVQNLAELVVNSADEVAKLIDQGNMVRAVAATQMNSRSSRSHSCFTIRIEQLTKETFDDGRVKESKLQSKINLVDLAGSERVAKTGAKGAQLKEGAMINKSLSALGNVINALSQGKKHIPYRDSKLTFLLKESLGGNARTTMIAAISPADYNYDETLTTLAYAKRAKTIKNEAKANYDVNERVIRELQDEVEKLRQQLAAAASAGAAGGSGASPDDGPSEKELELEEMLANLQKSQQATWEEKERLSKKFEEERKRNLANEGKVKEMMETMKEEKVELMKGLQRLGRDKKKLMRTAAGQRKNYDKLKKQLEKDMKRYEDMMVEESQLGESSADQQRRDALGAEMATLIQEIEAKKNSVLAQREAINETKEMLAANEKQIMEGKAELLSHTSMLQQDEKLRESIRDEMKAELDSQKEAYLRAALEDERKRLREEFADADPKRVASRLRIAQLEREIEVEGLRNELQTEKRRARSALEKVALGFEAELLKVRRERDDAKQKLAAATLDIAHLLKRNAELERELVTLVYPGEKETKK